MWWIFLFFIFGIISGLFSQNEKLLTISEKAVNIVVYFLLFLLGVSTGTNKKLISDFPSIGFEALLIAVFSLTGCFVFSSLWERFVCNRNDIKNEVNGNNKENKISITGSLYVAFSFVLGIFSGFFLNSDLDFLKKNDLITPTLYILLFFVGFSIGSDRNVLKNIKKIGKKALLFPLITVVGTLIGSLGIVLFKTNFSYFDAMAVGSGFGYYSLSSVIIAGLKGDRLATVALVANIIREVFTILFAPIIYSLFGRFALISSGGATSMDTTLPVIIRYSGKEFAIISVYHGIVLSVLVPFLVTFFCKI
ncbi:conserved hypothetical protein [Thermotomaculum hydrothermale]|uniref:Lysine exporter LysO family protein n=1 Tax=Thermotomaculum hydrothermale TaxID=981385 RepID=A0A7R6PG62_9BACT|nr:lysine exporter LysO family protein [Thermotomaculum hydrothermale]BBB31989.1 conserved hypothetical protein [Thermotomaculum hydrothermale]